MTDLAADLAAELRKRMRPHLTWTQQKELAIVLDELTQPTAPGGGVENDPAANLPHFRNGGELAAPAELTEPVGADVQPGELGTIHADDHLQEHEL